MTDQQPSRADKPRNVGTTRDCSNNSTSLRATRQLITGNRSLTATVVTLTRPAPYYTSHAVTTENLHSNPFLQHQTNFWKWTIHHTGQRLCRRKR